MAVANKKKLPVCINVFPTLDYIELVQLDEETRDIKVTAAIPCSFDPVTRQISNIELFEQSIRDLFVANRIPFTTPVVLVLPSLLTREFEVPSEMSRDEVLMMATSEAERFNIFKNIDTHVDLLKITPVLYIYSAYPAQEIEKFSLAFNDLKIPLKAIEINYFSILRGLLATGTIAEEASTNENWTLLVVSESTFFIGIFQGIQVITMSETLLSQNIETGELLQEIKDDYASFTRHQRFEKLVVINNNNRLDTDAMLDLLDLSVPVANIDQKPNNLVSRGSVEATLPCTLEAIGGVFSTEFKELPSLDLRMKAKLVEGIEELRNKLFYGAIGACAVLFAGCLILWGGLSLLINMKTEEVNTLTKNAAKSMSVQDVGAFADVQQKLFAKKAYAQNIDMNNTLVKFEQHVGADIWLESLTIVNPLTETPVIEKLPVDLRAKGDALSTDKINGLTNDLKKDLAREDLTVPTIEGQKKGDVEYWDWVIATKNLATTADTKPSGEH